MTPYGKDDEPIGFGKMRASIRETFFFAEAHTAGGKRQAPVRDAPLQVRWVDVENCFELQAVKPSCPLRKALTMLFRGELSEMR